MRPDDLYATITDQLIADIEAGAGNWHMPWHTLAAAAPRSVDGHRYRGINALWLAMTADTNGWPSGLWATYKAWQRHGAQVRRGERGTSVLLWKTLDRTADNQTTEPPDRDDTPVGRRRLVARTFTVFAAEQADGADHHQATDTAGALLDETSRVDHAERYFAAIGAHVHLGANLAAYRPGTDTIHLPAPTQFDRPAHFWATAAHEHVHWSGHPTRLARDLTGRFGTDAYAAEELVAELGAALWSAEAGLAPVTRPNHAAYLAGWLRILRADPRHLLTVASKAQAALDHLTTTAGHPPIPDPIPALG
jgi:antirestriction protein ArdC